MLAQIVLVSIRLQELKKQKVVETPETLSNEEEIVGQKQVATVEEVQKDDLLLDSINDNTGEDELHATKKMKVSFASIVRQGSSKK